jgi:RimJ/RimL family protein N-acetyltransferase
MREVIEAGTFTLRRYGESMVEELYEAGRESIEHMYPFMPWCHSDLSREECAGWIASLPANWRAGTAYEFAIFDGARYLGGCGLNQIRERDAVANLGYWVRSTAAKKGVATDAVRALAQAGFRDLELARIEIYMSVENERSRRVAEKIGAHFEGVMRSRILLYDRRHDARLYSLVP